MFDKNTELKKEIVYYAKLLDEKDWSNYSRRQSFHLGS